MGGLSTAQSSVEPAPASGNLIGVPPWREEDEPMKIAMLAAFGLAMSSGAAYACLGSNCATDGPTEVLRAFASAQAAKLLRVLQIDGVWQIDEWQINGVWQIGAKN